MMRLFDSIATRFAGGRPPLACSVQDGECNDANTLPRREHAATLESALAGALDRNELFLHYQPQACLASGRIVAVEVLLRWQSPVWGRVPPDTFIPLAEQSGLIVPIGEWVLREACAQLRAWQSRGLPPVAIAVNVSPRQFCEGDLVASVHAILDEQRVPPRLVELELTEGRMLHDPEQVAAALRLLRKTGVRIALDDFGTGFSSLAHLQRLSVDTIKIDRSFIRNLGRDPQRGVIVGGILAIARGLGLRVVAEGVETESELGYLRDRGCDHVQGYLTGRPVPGTEVGHLLRAGGVVCRGRLMDLATV